MEHLGVADEEELEHVCSERETALDRPLHHWEREALHLHLRNESLKAVSREERLLTPGFDKVICFSFGSHLLDLLIVFGWFPWFLMVPGWFFMVFLQNVPAPNCILARQSRRHRT